MDGSRIKPAEGGGDGTCIEDEKGRAASSSSSGRQAHAPARISCFLQSDPANPSTIQAIHEHLLP